MKTKSNLFWIIVLTSFVAVSAVAALLIGGAQGSVAHIYSDGQLIMSISLTTVTSPYTMTVEANGGLNTIEIEHGRIRVSEADCKDGSCMRQGWVSGGLVPIVCLPHSLVIQIEGDSDIDAIVG